MSRMRLALIACAATLAVGAAAWGLFHSQVRVAYWDRLARRELGGDELRELAECVPPGWWTLVKVVEQDADAPCGEPWMVEALADRVRGSSDRAAWLAWRARGVVPGRGLRASLALAVAGERTPVEPATWLARGTVPAERADAISVAAAEGAPWGVQLGPRGMALALALALREGRIGREQATPALAWLSTVGDPLAEEAVASAAAAALGLDEAWLTRALARTGRPAWQVPEPWRRTLAHRSCSAGACGAVWVALLSLAAAEAEAADDAELAPPVGEARLERLARLAGADDDRVAALAWGVDAAAAWVEASPDRAARLQSLAAGGGSSDPVPFARTLWDGAGSPFAVAAVVSAVGRRAGVAVGVRSSGDGVVWWKTDDLVGARAACGGVVGAMPSEVEWPLAAVEAAALVELASVAGEDAPRIAASAARLDPLVGAGAVDRVWQGEHTADQRAGRLAGEALARPIPPPSGAVEERRRYGANPPTACGDAVRN